MASFSAGTTFTDGVANDVTAAKLAALVNAATPTSGLIQDRTAETAIAADDTLLFGDFSDSNNLKRITVANFNNVVTTGTGTAASPAIVPTGDSNTGIFFPAADTIAFSEGGAEAMRIDSSGQVGIGTTSPATKLSVVASANSGINVTNGTMTGIFFNSSDTSIAIGSTSNHPVTLLTNNAERLRIDSSGNVGIGTSSPACKLNVETSAVSEVVRFESKASGDVANSILNIVKKDNDNTTSQLFVQFLINGFATGSGRINANGANSAAFGSYSDSRLKENITALPSQLANICLLKPSEFDYKNGSGHQIGFIAQEMQEVYPDSVGVGDDGMLTITAWSKTEARLVKAIQELKAKNDSLEARLQALEAT